MTVMLFHQAFGQALFDALHAMSFDGLGMARPSFSEKENEAHEMLCTIAPLHHCTIAPLHVGMGWKSGGTGLATCT
ncbi:hypothetical protein [Acetobacter orientalis]|uniref:hypothetical protein n=1 Tax=Acetobacter orientalis TaxID=146474 RepID=UPI0039EBCBF8